MMGGSQLLQHLLVIRKVALLFPYPSDSPFSCLLHLLLPALGGVLGNTKKMVHVHLCLGIK
jgi:hypothetical protein